jgi:superfamily II DNA/RNA helicase
MTSRSSILANYQRLALNEFGFKSPTAIQRSVWSALEKNTERDILFGAETGSGKTLAFMVPLLTRVKELDELSRATPMRPRGLIIAPTRELAFQLTSVAKRLAHVFKLRVRAVSAERSALVESHVVERDACDVLVATPGRLAALREAKALFVSHIAFAAVDEADVLVDRGFRDELNRIVTPLLAKRQREPPEACQFALCAATLTNELRHYARDTFSFVKPPMAVIESPTLHHSVASGQHEFLEVDRLNKFKVLTSLVRDCLRDGHVALVFCRSVDSCRFVSHEFDALELAHVSLHAQLPPQSRGQALKRIVARAPDDEGARIVVASDVLARGMDFAGDQPVTVILFDFPTSPSDYLHRAGRTARAGASGRIVSLVGSRDRALAAQIQRCIRERRPLTEIEVTAPSMYHASHNELDATRRIERPKPRNPDVPRRPRATPRVSVIEKQTSN